MDKIETVFDNQNSILRQVSDLMENNSNQQKTFSESLIRVNEIYASIQEILLNQSKLSVEEKTSGVSTSSRTMENLRPSETSSCSRPNLRSEMSYSAREDEMISKVRAFITLEYNVHNWIQFIEKYGKTTSQKVTLELLRKTGLSSSDANTLLPFWSTNFEKIIEVLKKSSTPEELKKKMKAIASKAAITQGQSNTQN